MSTEGVGTVSGTRHAIDQRLDAIDRALLGILPRGERLEIVSKLEARIGELLAADGSVEVALQAIVPESASGSAVIRDRSRTRSRAAVTAGICGIASVLLLFVMFPLAYVVVGTLASAMNADGALLAILLGIFPLAALVAGCLAVVLGIVGLVKIARRNGTLVGRGWAITGLCTGPLPAMVAAAPLLLIASQLVLASAVTVSVAPSPPGACTTCGPSPVYAPTAAPHGYGAPAYGQGPATLSAMPAMAPPGVPGSPYAPVPVATPQSDPYAYPPATIPANPSAPQVDAASSPAPLSPPPTLSETPATAPQGEQQNEAADETAPKETTEIKEAEASADTTSSVPSEDRPE